MLRDVDALVGEGRVVQRRQMPRVQAADVQQAGNERMPHQMDERAEPARASERTDDADADNVRQAAEQGANRSAKGDERRRDDGEEHVLDHVHAEELGREQIDSRDEREEHREESRKEECRPPDRPPPAHTPHAGGVNERREGHRRD